MWKSFLLMAAILACGANQSFGDLIFHETFGTVTGNTAFSGGNYTNGVGLTFTGTGDLRTTTNSSGYSTSVNGVSTPASGNANVFLTNGGTRSLIIGGINTNGFDPNSFSLNFGAIKSTIASDLTDLVVSFSTDGVNFTNLNPQISVQPTGSGTANWRALSLLPVNLPNSSNLSLRFLNTSTTNQVRLDDISMSGTITAVPEPSSIAFVCLVGSTVLAANLRRRKQATKAV